MMGNYWSINLPDLLADNGTIAAYSPRGLRLAQYWTEIVAQASNYDEPTTLKCRRRPRRRPCGGLLTLFFDVDTFDVLVGMDLLTRKQLEDWRRGRTPYLERVINCNLARLARVLRILRFHAHDLNLKPSLTVYVRSGSGPKDRLRFTKTGDPRLEEAYATHFVWPGKGPYPLSGSKGDAP
jgi:hypothetical protein